MTGKKFLNIKRGLDVGCGTGRSIFFLQYLGVKEIWGIDISSAMLEICKNNLEQSGYHAELCLASAEHMPFEDESFDLITCFSSLHHFKSWKRGLEEMYRILKKSGECYCVFERRKKEGEKISKIINLKRIEETGLDFHQFDENKIYEAAFQIGFDEVRIKEKDFVEFIYHKLIRKFVPTNSLKIFGYLVSELMDEFFRPIVKEYFIHLDIYLKK